MDVVLRTFCPQNPAVNAHHGVVEIDHHVAEKSEIEQDVNVQRGRNDSGRINPDVLPDRKIDTQNSEESRNRFQKNLKVGVGFIRFQKQLVEIHATKDSEKEGLICLRFGI